MVFRLFGVTAATMPFLRNGGPSDPGCCAPWSRPDGISTFLHSRWAISLREQQISRRISSDTLGLPPRDRDFHRQNKRKPARCQRMTVSGFTITKAFTTPGAIQ
jgi:hypothetical protein